MVFSLEKPATWSGAGSGAGSGANEDRGVSKWHTGRYLEAPK